MNLLVVLEIIYTMSDPLDLSEAYFFFFRIPKRVSWWRPAPSGSA